MNVYDKAHELARALRGSEEMKRLLAAKALLDADETTQRMVKDYLAKQMELEYEVLSGKGENKEKAEQLQRMFDLVRTNSRANEFLQCYMRFQQLMADISRIIGEAAAEGMDVFDKK